MLGTRILPEIAPGPVFSTTCQLATDVLINPPEQSPSRTRNAHILLNWVSRFELGLQVEFHTEGHDYMRGDYWVIPPRSLTGGIDWPYGKYLPARRADSGVARPASMTIDGGGKLTGDPKDLRSLIAPAGKQVP
jgi:hypothetical protein